MILNQFGTPYTRFLESSQQSINRPAWPVRTEGIRYLVNTFDLRTVISASRRLSANMGIVKGALHQKAMFAIGRAWHPIFQGKAQAWGEQAIEWLLNEWYPVCEVRGGAFDFVTSLYLDSITIDRDGGFGVLLTESEDGYPMTQRIPIHRFGLRFDAWEHIIAQDEGWRDENGKFVRSPYVGCRIHQGIIYNKQGRPIAYRIYEDEPLNMQAAMGAGKFQDISERDLIHVYDPEWYDQGHGFPAFTHAVNLFRDMMQSQEWEQLNMMASSAQSLIEYNETGTADANDPAIALERKEGTPTGLHTESLEGGLIRYFKANSGSKLEQFVNNRPGPAWDAFNDRLARVALAGANWPYSLVWKADGGGTDKRSDIMQARQTTEDRQDLQRPYARRMVGYAVSKAMKLGILPPYPVSADDKAGFLKWAFSTPPKMGIDDGRDGKARLDNLSRGRMSRTQDAYDMGTTLDTIRNQRDREARDLITRAQAISTDMGVPFPTALALLQMDNVNQPVAQQGNSNAGQDNEETE